MFLSNGATRIFCGVHEPLGNLFSTVHFVLHRSDVNSTYWFMLLNLFLKPFRLILQSLRLLVELLWVLFGFGIYLLISRNSRFSRLNGDFLKAYPPEFLVIRTKRISCDRAF